jgi:hypothetical protein
LLALALAGSSLALAAPAQADYRVEPTGSMAVPRVGAAAAALPDGRVLVAGGLTKHDPRETEAGVAMSAEIYDPATGKFSATASPLERRDDAATAPLPGGRVLIVGGANTIGPPLATAEIYDPRTASFSATGEMAVARHLPFAAPLPDGRVLVGGGGENGYRPGDPNHGLRDSAEIYDPRTGEFSPTGSLPALRTAAEAAPLPDGRVLVAGGSDGEEVVDGDLIFDPATESFSYTGSLTAHELGQAAVPLGGGVLFFGWSEGLHAEAFDPGSESFSEVPVDLPKRGYMAFAPLPGDRVLMAGGNDSQARVGISEEAYVLVGPPPGEAEPEPGDGDSGRGRRDSSARPGGESLSLRRGSAPRIHPRQGPYRLTGAGRAVAASIACPQQAWGACRLTAARATLGDSGHTHLTLLAPRRIERGRRARVVVELPVNVVERLRGGAVLSVAFELEAAAPNGARSHAAFKRLLIP